MCLKGNKGNEENEENISPISLQIAAWPFLASLWLALSQKESIIL
jgi:hypothetical protein